MDDHDFTDLDTLAGLYDCVRDLRAERDRLRAVVDAALPVLRQVTDTLRDSDGGPLDAWAVADVTAQLYRSLAGQPDGHMEESRPS